MNLLKKLLAVIASAGMMASAHATTYDMGTLSPTVQEQSAFYGSGSFMDIYNFSVSAEQGALLASAVSYTPSGISTDITHVTALTIAIYGGADGTGSVLGTASSSNGSLLDYSNVLATGTFSAKVSGLADGLVGGGYNFSIAAVPEPSGWMMLLAGLVVVGFMARRKTDLLAG
jgi:hypothetical protein